MEEPIITAILLIAPFVLPSYTAWTHPNWKGVLVGALTLWLFLFLSQVFLIGRYGTGGPAGFMLVLWFWGGWLLSGIYCTVVASVRSTMQ